MEIADGSGTDFLTVDDSVITSATSLLPSTTCTNDRADVAALKAIVTQLLADPTHQAIFQHSPDGVKTGRERALDMLNAFEEAITNDADYAGQGTEIGAFADEVGAITIADVVNNAETDPAFELFSLVIGTLDDINVANGALAQIDVDPVVSYDSTSLMNMPKSAFDDMIDQIQVRFHLSGLYGIILVFFERPLFGNLSKPLVTGAADAATLKSSYQTLINENGNTAPSKQVFWNFLKDTESPGTFSILIFQLIIYGLILIGLNLKS